MTWLDRWSRRGLGREGAERVSAGCYGSIVAASTLAGSAAVPPGELALLVVATNLVYFSTHVFAYSIGDPNVEGKHLPQVAAAPRAGCRSDGQRGVPSPRRCAGVGDPGRGSPAGHQCRRDHGGRAVGRCGTSRRLSAGRAWLGTGITHRCDPGDDYGACPREALAHALTRALARPTSGLAPSTTTSPLSPSPSKRRSPMCWRSSGSCSTGSVWTSRTPPRPAPSRSG